MTAMITAPDFALAGKSAPSEGSIENPEPRTGFFLPRLDMAQRRFSIADTRCSMSSIRRFVGDAFLQRGHPPPRLTHTSTSVPDIIQIALLVLVAGCNQALQKIRRLVVTIFQVVEHVADRVEDTADIARLHGVAELVEVVVRIQCLTEVKPADADVVEEALASHFLVIHSELPSSNVWVSTHDAHRE